MSMYGDNKWDKNDLYDEIKSFLEAHPISELLEVVMDAVESYEYSEKVSDDER